MAKPHGKMAQSGAQGELQRIQLDIERDRLEDMSRLMRLTSVRSRRELFDHALSLFEWAVEEVQRGNVIAALDVEANTYQRLEMPSLRAARRNVGKPELSTPIPLGAKPHLNK